MKTPLLPIFVLITLFLSNCSTGKKTNPKIGRVGVYLYNLNDRYSESEIIENGRLNANVATEEFLSKRQIKKLDAILANNPTNNSRSKLIPPTECFYPKHGIVFYDESAFPIQFLSICFECHQIKSSNKWSNDSPFSTHQLALFIRKETNIPVSNIPKDYEKLEKIKN